MISEKSKKKKKKIKYQVKSSNTTKSFDLPIMALNSY